MVKSWNNGFIQILSSWILFCLMGCWNQISAEELSYDLDTSEIDKDVVSSVRTLIEDDSKKYGNLQAIPRSSAIKGPYFSLGISNDKTSVSIQIVFAKLDTSGETTVGDQKLRSMTTVNYYIAEWEKLSMTEQSELLKLYVDSNLKVILTHYAAKHVP